MAGTRAAPVLGKSGLPYAAQPTLLANELTAAFRINRELMLKASYYTLQPYAMTRTGWDQQVAVQAVFQRRWW